MFRRLSNLIRGFFGLFVSGLERQNPEALLEVEQENLRKQIGQYNQGLASHAGLCERLIAQVRQLESEQRDLRAKATANLRAGNRDAAAQYALRLQTVERELEENRNQLEQAEKTYKDLVRARQAPVPRRFGVTVHRQELGAQVGGFGHPGGEEHDEPGPAGTERHRPGRNAGQRDPRRRRLAGDVGELLELAVGAGQPARCARTD